MNLAATCVLAVVVAVLLWIMTGISPFLWCARLMLHTEAARQQAWSSLGVAVIDYRRNYRGTLSVVKAMEAQER